MIEVLGLLLVAAVVFAIGVRLGIILGARLDRLAGALLEAGPTDGSAGTRADTTSPSGADGGSGPGDVGSAKGSE